jgi:hypothetical protein
MTVPIDLPQPLARRATEFPVFDPKAPRHGESSVTMHSASTPLRVVKPMFEMLADGSFRRADEEWLLLPGARTYGTGAWR